MRLVGWAAVVSVAVAGSPGNSSFASLFLAAVRAQSQGSNVEQTLTTIQAAIAAGDLTSALQSVSSALKQYPKEAGLYNLRGVIHAKQEELPGARADFERAVRLDPQLAPAWKNLSRVCQLLTGSDASAASCAIDGWERVLRMRPADTEARISLATVYEWQGKFAESLRHIQRLPVEESSRASVLSLRCADAAGLDRSDQVDECSRLAKAEDFTDADAVSVFPVLQSPKAAPIVVTLVQALDRRNSASPSSLQHLAVAYEQLKLNDDARKTLERVALLEPNNAPHLIELARLAYLARDCERALGYLAHARDLTPNNPQIHFLFGMIAMEMELPIEARRSLERALALDPGNPRYNYAMGSVALNSRDASQSVAHFQAYVAAQPDDPRGHFALGIAYFATSDYAHAAQEMEGVRTNRETAAGAEYFLGRLARIDENLDQAASHLERSIQLLPSFAESRAELAHVRLRQGLIEQARAELDRALALDRDSFQANATLLALYQRTHDPSTKEQAARLQQLDAQRSARQELMLRTIEVKPY